MSAGPWGDLSEALNGIEYGTDEEALRALEDLARMAWGMADAVPTDRDVPMMRAIALLFALGSVEIRRQLRAR